MTNKNYIKLIFKYLIMFMALVATVHVVGKNQMTNEQIIIIAIVGSTVFIALDYYAPQYIISVNTNIINNDKCQ